VRERLWVGTSLKQSELSIMSKRPPPQLKLLGNVEESVGVKLEASLRLR
jgi:hypothetical protein